jgi:hypothetical protein
MILDIFKEPVNGVMTWSSRRFLGAGAAVVGVVAGFLDKKDLMQACLTFAGACFASIGISEIGKK